MASTVLGLRALVSVISTNEGGRRSPVYSGYIAQVYMLDIKMEKDAHIFFENMDIVMPGTQSIAMVVWFVVPKSIRLDVGAQLLVREGKRVVAEGTVVAIYSAEFVRARAIVSPLEDPEA